MKRKHPILLTVFILFVGIILAVTALTSIIKKNLEHLSDLPIAEIDLTRINDGIYIGSYSAFPVAAKVDVEIKDHKITGITLIKHTHGQGSKAEIMPQKVVEAQSLDVDAVSGATYSSKVILKAVENALANKINKISTGGSYENRNYCSFGHRQYLFRCSKA